MKISKEKAKIFFLKNAHHNRAIQIADEFGFLLMHDLGKYLGVPLHHKSMSGNSFSHITNKLLQRLNNLVAGKLEFRLANW